MNKYRTPRHFFFATALTLLGMFTFSSSCVLVEEEDYYSQVKDVCSYTFPRHYLDIFHEDRNHFDTYADHGITQQCKARLEAILDFDDTWDQAPLGLKNKVLEAFQVLAGYPLAIPPRNHVWGVECSIPMGFIQQFFPEQKICTKAPHFDDPREITKRVFNYVMNRVGRITYGGPKLGDKSATNYPDPKNPGGKYLLSIFDRFWIVRHPYLPDAYYSPFSMASTLFHESRHGDGIFHQYKDGEFATDPELNGPYGWQIIYKEMLIQGSLYHRSELDPQWPALSVVDAEQTAYSACEGLKQRIIVGTHKNYAKNFPPNGCESVTLEDYAQFGDLPKPFWVDDSEPQEAVEFLEEGPNGC